MVSVLFAFLVVKRFSLAIIGHGVQARSSTPECNHTFLDHHRYLSGFLRLWTF